jgi:hypothetical protein
LRGSRSSGQGKGETKADDKQRGDISDLEENPPKVDNPDDHRGEPIPGGPTDPNASRLAGED